VNHIQPLIDNNDGFLKRGCQACFTFKKEFLLVALWRVFVLPVKKIRETETYSRYYGCYTRRNYPPCSGNAKANETQADNEGKELILN